MSANRANSVLPSDSEPWRCPWAACSSDPITRTEAERESHCLIRLDGTLQIWLGACKCIWPNCSSKATFKSRSSLRTHLINIHVKPLLCTEPLCRYKKPFSKQYELDRHVSTAHGDTRNHKCPIDTCEVSVTGFARKDKLVKHLREEHENLKCPYNHCFAAVVATQEEEHIQKSHGDYECAIGGCKAGISSRFTLNSARSHLRAVHGIDWYTSFNMIELPANIHTVTASLLRLRSTPKNCATCSSHQQAELLSTE